MPFIPQGHFEEKVDSISSKRLQGDLKRLCPLSTDPFMRYQDSCAELGVDED